MPVPTLLSVLAFALTVAAQAQPPTVSTHMIESDDNQVRIEVHAMAGTEPSTAIIFVGGSNVTLASDTTGAVPVFLSENAAVILHDRRGHGGSTGAYERPNTANTEWLIPAIGSDVIDIAAWLDAQGYQRIGVAGSSMGAWVAASAAAGSDHIDFMVGLVAGAVPVAVSDAFDQAIDEGGSIEAALAVARATSTDIGYDPGPDLVAIDQPGLWVFGELDRSNPTAADVAALDGHIEAGKPFRYRVIARANHELVNIDTGEMDTSWIGELRAFIAQPD